ncbi:MAG: hypothetical protein MRZ79_03005 [Bacteroidia bacterium]|nr:hypothetical protein [Bacteroidia bacterium]
MKTVFLIFGLFFSLSVFGQNSFGQSSYVSYTVAGIPVEEVNENLVSLSFRPAKVLRRQFFVELNFGQACFADAPLIYGQGVLKKCTGIVDAKGNLVVVSSHIEALNMLEKMGWKLQSVVINPGEEATDPISSTYILRKEDKSQTYPR